MDEIYLVYLNNIFKKSPKPEKEKTTRGALVANCRGPDPNLTKNKQKIEPMELKNKVSLKST